MLNRRPQLKEASVKQPPAAREAQPVSPAQAAIPIIVVPSSFTTLINMYNAKMFLEDESFITPQEARAKGPVRKEIRLRIINKETGTPFFIIDNVNRLEN